MALSKEEERYKQFESLREKFSTPSAQKQVPQLHEITQPSSAGGKARRASYNPRANAPPLMPLIEEGDQIQQQLHVTPVDERLQKLARPKIAHASTPVKGKWKYSSHLKSNHLNGQDFDALETASVTSCSSAYSSKSESSTFSPFGPGSVTELSDVGSCDTFLEYDHQPSRNSLLTRNSKFVDPLTMDDIPSVMVPRTTKAWNAVIGDWVFQGISQQLSPSKLRMRRPSNEVRLPTPLSTPQGSTHDLLKSDSRCSLLSFSSGVADEDPPQSPPTPYKLGTFVRPESNLITHQVSTSSLIGSEKASEPISICGPGPRPSNKWQEALARYRRESCVESGVSERTENLSIGSVVEARAERFGGTKKKSLRRAQSFHMGTRTTPVQKPILY